MRYGNVVGSRGSVAPIFLEQRTNGSVTVTDPRMTRFWITLDQGVRFVLRCIQAMRGGEVFVPKIPSMNILTLAEALAPGCEIEEIGIRSGEKLHEVLISEHEARQTVEWEGMYVIQPAHPWWTTNEHEGAVPLPADFCYASDTNEDWLDTEALRTIAGNDV